LAPEAERLWRESREIPIIASSIGRKRRLVVSLLEIFKERKRYEGKNRKRSTSFPPPAAASKEQLPLLQIEDDDGKVN
jgi:hypothetical protein